MSIVQRYRDTYNSPTLILVDLDFLAQEVGTARDSYAGLFSGKDPQYPAKEIPHQVSAQRLLRALCKYGVAREDISTLVLFQQPSTPPVVSSLDQQTARWVKCDTESSVEMLFAIAEYPEVRRLVIMADSPQYTTLIKWLRTSGYSICLIKHRQEYEHDPSSMAPDLPYQFAFYVVGESLGLEPHEI